MLLQRSPLCQVPQVPPPVMIAQVAKMPHQLTRPLGLSLFLPYLMYLMIFLGNSGKATSKNSVSCCQPLRVLSPVSSAASGVLDSTEPILLRAAATMAARVG